MTYYEYYPGICKWNGVCSKIAYVPIDPTNRKNIHGNFRKSMCLDYLFIETIRMEMKKPMNKLNAFLWRFSDYLLKVIGSGFNYREKEKQRQQQQKKKYRTADGNGGHTAQCTRDKNKQKHMKLYLRAPQMESRWIHFEEREKTHTKNTTK